MVGRLTLRTYIADDLATTNITTTLPNPSSLAHPLTYLSIDDDYTDFMNKAQLQNYQVWEGNNNVTSEYTVTNYNGHLTAVRKDASKAPGSTLRLVATWKINDNVPSGTKLTNKGSSRITITRLSLTSHMLLLILNLLISTG